MGTAGGKGLATPNGHSDPQDGRYNMNVGDDNAYEGDHKHGASQGKNHQLIDAGVRTGQLQDRSYVTEKVSYFPNNTEG